MTTSGTFNFSVNRDQIIRMGLLSIEKLDEVEVPSPQETSDCSMMLNMLVKQFQGTADGSGGLKTWTRRTGFLFLSGTQGVFTIGPTAIGWTNSFVNPTTTTTCLAGGSSFDVTSTVGMTLNDNIGVMLDSQTIYWSTVKTIIGQTITIYGALPSQASSGNDVYDYTTAAQQPLMIETAVLRDSYGNDTPLDGMTLQQYAALPSKASPTYISDPTKYYYEFQLGYSNFKTDVYGCQDMTKYIVVNYMETIQDLNNPADTPEYPQEWFLPLSLGLGKLMAPIYHATWTPLLEENYQNALKIAQNKDPEERITQFFQPGAD